MLNRIIRFFAAEPPAGSRRVGAAARGRHLPGHPRRGRCLPRPERPDGRRHDRSQRHGRRRGRAAGHLSHRDRRERRHGRAPRPLLIDHRLLGRLGRVRMGHGHLPRPSDRLREARRHRREPSRQCRQPDARTPVVDPRRAAHRRPDGRQHLDARPEDAGRLDDPPAAALDRRRGAGGRTRRRRQGSTRSCSTPSA